MSSAIRRQELFVAGNTSFTASIPDRKLIDQFLCFKSITIALLENRMINISALPQESMNHNQTVNVRFRQN